ncbi:MAG: hypothetical protein CL917_19265 [Deltaproteobacteria bacterium]|nr:hypothetical protein [Deltaproteobacteria bacterium]
MPASIPLISSAAAVTPEWLSLALTQGGFQNLEITGFETESIGTGQVGENVRFTLQYSSTSPPGPTSLVLKLPSENPVSRATAVAQGIYSREVHFYTELAQSLNIRTPQCWHADLSEAGDQFILVFEDMAPSEQGDQIIGCTPNQARLAMAEAARLHAPRWNDPKLTQLSWLPNPGPESAGVLKMLYQSVVPGFESRFESRVSPEVIALAHRFGEKIGQWAEFSEGPRSVVHGDYRLDNMLFGNAPHHVPLAVVDWQTCALGHPASDVAYFIGAGLLPEKRREEEMSLLAHYLEVLNQQGITSYSMDELVKDYRRFSFSGLIMAIIASQIVEVSERGDAMFAVMAERHTHQILDHDAESIF